MKQRLTFVLITFAISVLFSLNINAFPTGTAPTGYEIDLFQSRGQTTTSHRQAELSFYHNVSSIVRYSRVSINSALTVSKKVQVGDRISLKLFEDKHYKATVDRVTVNVNGTFVVRARLDDYEMGYLLMSTTGNRSYGTVDIPELGEEYEIVSNNDGNYHYLLELDRAKKDVIETSPAIRTEPSESNPIQESEGFSDRVIDFDEQDVSRDDNPADVTVMIVYTPAAKSWADDWVGIDNIISQAMERGQLAFDNSLTQINFILSFSSLVDYNESSNSSTDLGRLATPNNEHLDIVHPWREMSGSDFVAMFTLVNDVGGIGRLLQSPSGNRTTAFSITRIQQAANTYTHVHEVGHNMGLHHHAEQNFQPGPGLFSYSSGWRWTGNDGNRYCSVMTYQAGQYFADGQDHTRVAYFSSPVISHQGVATGHIELADNRRNLREIKHVVAAYSKSPDRVASVEGYVTLETTDEPVSGARVELIGIDYPLFTDENGYFFVYSVPGNSVDLRVSKYDHHTTTFEDIALEIGNVITLEISIEKFHRMNISGNVTASDFPEQGLENAFVTLRGIEEFSTLTDEEGMFYFENVRSGFDYELLIERDGYVNYDSVVAIEEYSADLELERIVMAEVAYPVHSLLAQEREELSIELNWGIPFDYYDLFRYDSGIAADEFGVSSGTNYTVYGSVYPGQSQVNEVSWKLGNRGGPHHYVNIFVFGLDEDNRPDHTEILYQQMNVDNVDNKWNSYQLPYTIDAPNGFLFGLSYAGNLGLVIDDGQSEEYPFNEGMHYLVIDYRTGNWMDIATTGWRRNLFLRAKGYDLAEPERMAVQKDSAATRSNMSVRALENFIVFRLIAGEETESQDWVELGRTDGNQFVDEEWNELINGDYRYVVIGEYTNGVRSLPTLSNTITYEEEFQSIVNLEIEFIDDEVTLNWEWSDEAEDRSFSASERAFIGFIVTRNGEELIRESPELYFVDQTLTSGRLMYEVRGEYTNGFTNTLNAYVDVLREPTSLSYDLLDFNRVELTWIPPEGITSDELRNRTNRSLVGYNIYRDDEVIDTLEEVTVYVDESTIAGESYRYFVTAVYEGELESPASNVVEVLVTSITDNTLLPKANRINGNYPNPFNPSTTISYSLKDSSAITLKIYDIRGRLVKTLYSGEQKAGKHSVVWDGFDDRGKSSGSGIYFVRMQTAEEFFSHKVLMIK